MDTWEVEGSRGTKADHIALESVSDTAVGCAELNVGLPGLSPWLYKDG